MTTATNDRSPANGTATLLSCGPTLAQALAAAPDSPVNAPLEVVDLVDERPTLDEPTSEECREIEDLADQLAADRYLYNSCAIRG